jgi:hypothetical protein
MSCDLFFARLIRFALVPAVALRFSITAFAQYTDRQAMDHLGGPQDGALRGTALPGGCRAVRRYLERPGAGHLCPLSNLAG